jgi:hypothetical protein
MNTIDYLGQNGTDLVANTTHIDGKWFAIQVVADAIFTSLADSTMTVAGTLGGITFLGGTLIFGSFSSFKLASGSVLAYKLHE